MSNENKIENVTPVENPAHPNHNETNDDSDRALTGKIARLPDSIREQLNQRLHDGQGGPEILAWLNDLPAVKEILAAQFASTPISHENLSNWRHNGYRRWLRQKQNVSLIKDLGKYAADVTQAGAGLAPAAASMASVKIFEFLESADAGNADPNNLVKLGATAAILRKGEHDLARIGIAKERLRQRDLALVLKRDKQQRDIVAVLLRYLNDARAKEIAASSAGHHEKIEILGAHMFNEYWEPRPIPTTPENSSS